MWFILAFPLACDSSASLALVVSVCLLICSVSFYLYISRFRIANPYPCEKQAH